MPFPHLTVTRNCTEKNAVIVFFAHSRAQSCHVDHAIHTKTRALFTNMEGDKDASDTDGRTQGKNMHMDSD